MMMGYGYGMGWLGGFGMVLFWGLMILGIVIFVRWFSNESARNPPPPTGRNGSERDQALEIARERLAKGEIKPEEFESIRRSLEP